MAYEFRGADELLVDFFAAVERSCAEEGSAFDFEAEEIELEAEEESDAQVHGKRWSSWAHCCASNPRT